jgi:hypothetical protein
MNVFPWDDRRVGATIDAAFAGAVDAFDPGAWAAGHDQVPSYVDVSPEMGLGVVTVDVGGTNVRVDVEPADARRLARLLAAAADALDGA